MEKGEGKRAKHLKHSPIIKNSLTKKMKTKHNNNNYYYYYRKRDLRKAMAYTGRERKNNKGNAQS